MAKTNPLNSSPKQKQSRHSVTIKKDKCKGCKLCVIYCPTKHLRLSDTLNKRGVHYAEINETTQCVGCGRCYLMCPDCCIEIIEE
ncbi:MAG: 4Fe-4S dicluster domain-containing protein [Candidatus Omnitrophica bacterium]|nr:4Fe-4S dicluster domain-containing protein [Candidatus Omnitrophota bacterium]